MDYIKTLSELSTYTAVSGFEKELAVYLKGLFEAGCDSVEIDKYYNVIAFKKGSGSDRKKIMLTAHMDEIGFLVKAVDEKGFIKVTNVGGVDSRILLAQEVYVHGRERLTGIFGAKPPHVLDPEEARKAVKIDDLCIDTGLSPEEVKKLVSIGDVVTYKTAPAVLQGSKLSSKSLDNRAGVAALLVVMEELQNLKHDSDIYFVATSQEEFRFAGIAAASYSIEPDIAIVFDVCHGDMPDTSKEDVHSLGKGPAISMGPNFNRKLVKKLVDTAKEENIPYQMDVLLDHDSTEAWITQVSRSGIPSVLVSIPLRYMHSPIETLHTGDLKNAGRLGSRFITRVEKEMEAILCF